MPLPYTETPEEYLTRHGSVMAPEATGYEKIRNLLFGSNPAEWAANYGTLGMGATRVLNVAPDLAASLPSEAAGGAVRSLGREMIDYLRRLIQQGASTPTARVAEGTASGYAYPMARRIALNPRALQQEGYTPEQVLRHELGHIAEVNLPGRARAPLSQAIQEEAPQALQLRAEYGGGGRPYSLDPAEVFAQTRENPFQRLSSPTQLNPETQTAVNRAYRVSRGILRSLLRRTGSLEDIGP